MERACFNCGRLYKTGKEKEYACIAVDENGMELPIKSISDAGSKYYALCPICTRAVAFSIIRTGNLKGRHYIKDLKIEYEDSEEAF